MAKLKTIRRSELKFESGYLLDADDNVVGFPGQCKIRDQFDNLMDNLSKAIHLSGQPDKSDGPTLADYVSYKDQKPTYVGPDEWALEAIQKEKERNTTLDNAILEVAKAERINKIMVEGFKELADFVDDDPIVFVDDEWAPCSDWDAGILEIEDGVELMNMLTFIDEQMQRLVTNGDPKARIIGTCCGKVCVEL